MLLRFFYLFYRGYTGLRDLVERRFTLAGLTVLGALVITGFMAVDTENNVDYQAFSLLVCLMLFATVFTIRFRGRFEAERVLPRFGTVGCPLTYSVRLRNLGSRTHTGLLLMELLQDARPPFVDWRVARLSEQKRLRSFRISSPRRTASVKITRIKSAPVPALPGHEQVEAKVQVTPTRRGVLRFAGLGVARPDPLGLCRATSKLRLPQSLLVLPRRYALPPIALPGTTKYQQGGVAQASHVGQSEEFISLRDYRGGDPLRHIHWRTWARVGKPVVREFEDEFFVRHALILDTFTEDEPEVFEEAVSVAASFACTVQTQETLLDLLFVGTDSYCFTAGRGLAHSEQLLEVLASVRPSSRKRFPALEALVLSHMTVVSGCVCVLLAWDAPRRELVRKIRTLGVPVLVLVIKPAGHKGALLPGPLSDTPQAFHVLQVGDIERGLATLGA